MIILPIKVENSSNYWCYDDELDQVWRFYWRASAYDFLYEHREVFMSHYLDLVEAYGFLLPLCYFDETEVAESKCTFLDAFFERIRGGTIEENWLPLHQLYNLDPNKTGEQRFPSLIFNHLMEPARPLVDIIRNEAVSDANNSGDSAVFLSSWLRPAEKRFGIGIHVAHDAFDLILKNKKTNRNTGTEIYKHGVDNFDLSILNAPRFNSFFREFRRLAEHFGAEVISDQCRAGFTLDGILYDGVANMYEDWVDELPEHGRIVTAISIQNLNNIVPKYDKPKGLDLEGFSASEIEQIKRTRERKYLQQKKTESLLNRRVLISQSRTKPEPERIIDTARREFFLEDAIPNMEKSLFQKPIGNVSNQGDHHSEYGEVKQSDYYDLAVKTYFLINNRSLSEFHSNQWNQFIKNIVTPAFDLDAAAYNEHLQALSIPFMGLRIEPNNIRESFEAIHDVIELEEDILHSLAVCMSDKNFYERTEFFQNASEWVQSKKWGVCFGYNFVTNFSLRQIAAIPNGQIFLRKKIIESPILAVK